MLKTVTAALAVTVIAGVAAAPAATAAPAVDKSEGTTISDSAVFRKETVNKVTYVAGASHMFNVAPVVGGVAYAGHYDGKVIVKVSRPAKSELKLRRTKVGEPRITDVKVRVKVKKANGHIRTVVTKGVRVSNNFTGWVVTKSGSVYRQTGTLTTTASKYGETTKIKLGPEVQVS